MQHSGLKNEKKILLAQFITMLVTCTILYQLQNATTRKTKWSRLTAIMLQSVTLFKAEQLKIYIRTPPAESVFSEDAFAICHNHRNI